MEVFAFGLASEPAVLPAGNFVAQIAVSDLKLQTTLKITNHMEIYRVLRLLEVKVPNNLILWDGSKKIFAFFVLSCLQIQYIRTIVYPGAAIKSSSKTEPSVALSSLEFAVIKVTEHKIFGRCVPLHSEIKVFAV